MRLHRDHKSLAEGCGIACFSHYAITNQTVNWEMILSIPQKVFNLHPQLFPNNLTNYWILGKAFAYKIMKFHLHQTINSLYKFIIVQCSTLQMVNFNLQGQLNMGLTDVDTTHGKINSKQLLFLHYIKQYYALIAYLGL